MKVQKNNVYIGIYNNILRQDNDVHSIKVRLCAWSGSIQNNGSNPSTVPYFGIKHKQTSHNKQIIVIFRSQLQVPGHDDVSITH